MFPRTANYELGWLTDGCYGANPLWLTEWLCQGLELSAGMHILDLGCGTARSSVFLAKEFGVTVTAVDLWNSATDNDQVIRDAGVGGRVHAMQLDARCLPFPDDYFDAVLSIDAFQYFGTDALFLPYILRFVKPNGQLAFASAGLTTPLPDSIPEHLTQFWQPDAWCLQTSDWWRYHWERTNLVTIEQADTMNNGWQVWLAWAEQNSASSWYINALKADAGKHLGYVRTIASRKPNQALLPYDLQTGR